MINTGKVRYLHDIEHHLELFPECRMNVEEMAHAALANKYYFIRRFKQTKSLSLWMDFSISSIRCSAACGLQSVSQMYVSISSKSSAASGV